MSEDVERLRRVLAAAREAEEQANRRALEARQEARAMSQANARLQETLRQAREKLETARDQLDAMTEPPLQHGTVVELAGDGADVQLGARRLRVAVDPELRDPDDGRVRLEPGEPVLLNDAMVVVARALDHATGEIGIVRETLPDGGRCIIAGAGDTDEVVRLGPGIADGVRSGDSVLVDRKAGIAYARVPREDVEDLVLEEVPDLDYTAIGGLSAQIQQVRDAVELPFLHADLYAAYDLTAPKGILLYGPPGCGKTMIAKAVAHSLAASTGEGGDGARSFFLNIKGPELLNKYVGETERQIRIIFQRARERATSGLPVIVFFDEMDSLFRTRGTGVSSDVENTIVPQLLSEIDGVEGLQNVIIIGASNREDMIDPAILRPGRLDVKIKLDRPDAAAAREIFAKYLNSAVPLRDDEIEQSWGDADEARRRLIDQVVAGLYASSVENRFLEVTYAGGDKEVLYFKDFSSGAMINNIVGRAKKLAIKDELATGRRGVAAEHLARAARDELVENEDLPNTTNPDDWARISGKKGERIVFIRTLVGAGTGRVVPTD